MWRRFILLLPVLMLSSPAFGITVPAAKQLEDNSQVSFTGVIVSYASTDFFYVQESNRSSGIRVEKAGHGLSAGIKADVQGTIKTNINKERYIAAASASRTAGGTATPIAIRSSSIGGIDYKYNAQTGAGQKGAAWSKGPNNIGLLIRTWGRYERIDPYAFLLDDGSGLYIKCSIPPGFVINSSVQYVAVTGISSIYKLNATTYPPVILVKDITVMLPTETITTPGTPGGTAAPKCGVNYAYTTTGATGSEGSTIEYSFDWGDGSTSPWSSNMSASHTWTELGPRSVTVTARSKTRPGASAVSLPLNIDVQLLEMVYIAAGTFSMGNSGVGDDSTYDKQQTLTNEKPQHSVTLPAFLIGKYEVTRGEYREFINAGGYTNQNYWSVDGWNWRVQSNRIEPAYWAAQQNWGTVPGLFTQTDNHPVIGITYHEAEAFCKWAGGSLPTEAQWEMAARWATNHANVYPWGDTWDVTKCKSRDATLYPGLQTAPVGSYPSGASPRGCLDMAGNGWEWVQDWYKSYPGSSSPFDETGQSRILRGGGFTGFANYGYFRCAYRYGCPPGLSWNDTSFRMAR